MAVILISKGRPEILDDTIDSILRQTLQPSQIVVVVPNKVGLPHKDRGNRVHSMVGPLGICAQRNAGADAVPEWTDLVAYFDDDVELRPDYLSVAVEFMRIHPEIAAFSGHLVAERVTRAEARRVVDLVSPTPEEVGTFRSSGRDYILHGCNMVIRRSILKSERFDENLPLYAYGEDYEMTFRLERHGRVGKFSGCKAVHLEVEGGRVRERQRGYSFVANNWYFVCKGSTHLAWLPAWIRFWLVCVAKPVVLCSLNWLRRDQSKDWAERTKGHLLALADIFRGRCHPKRIVEL